MQERICFERADWPLAIKVQKQAEHVVRYRSTRTHARVSSERTIHNVVRLRVPCAHQHNRLAHHLLDVHTLVQLGMGVLARVAEVLPELLLADLLWTPHGKAIYYMHNGRQLWWN